MRSKQNRSIPAPCLLHKPSSRPAYRATSHSTLHFRPSSVTHLISRSCSHLLFPLDIQLASHTMPWVTRTVHRVARAAPAPNHPKTASIGHAAENAVQYHCHGPLWQCACCKTAATLLTRHSDTTIDLDVQNLPLLGMRCVPSICLGPYELRKIGAVTAARLEFSGLAILNEAAECES